VDAFSIAMVTPLSPFLVRYLGLVTEWNDTGWWVGYISCAYVMGRLITFTAWSALATAFGKRAVILTSLMVLTISHILLGLSTSITWVVIVRFCAGAGNGILPALCSTPKQGRAITNDFKGSNENIRIEQQNVYYGSGLAYMVWACGLVAGPGMIGLLLPEVPAGRQSMGNHPFLEPCFFAAGVSMIVFILCWLHLNEKQTDAGVRAVASTSLLEWRKVFEDGSVVPDPGSPVYVSNVSSYTMRSSLSRTQSVPADMGEHDYEDEFGFAANLAAPPHADRERHPAQQYHRDASGTDRVNPGHDLQRTVSWGPDTRTFSQEDMPRTISYPGLHTGEDTLNLALPGVASGSSLSLHSSDSGEDPILEGSASYPSNGSEQRRNCALRHSQSMMDISVPSSPRSLGSRSLTRSNSSFEELRDSGLPPAPPRFVLNNSGDKRAAQKQWEEHLEWREKNDIDAMVHKPWKHFHLLKKNYPGNFHGRDKKGNICYFEQLGKVQIGPMRAAGLTADDILYHCNFNTEFLWSTALSPREEDRLVTVLDVGGIGMSVITSEVISYIQQSGVLLERHYPERSLRIFVVNAPYWFDTAWGWVKPVVPKMFTDKIKICSSSTMRDQLLEFIDEDQLPLEYAGANPSPECVPLGQGPCELKLREHVAKLDRGESTEDVEIVIGLDGQLKLHGMSPVPSSSVAFLPSYLPSYLPTFLLSYLPLYIVLPSVCFPFRPSFLLCVVLPSSFLPSFFRFRSRWPLATLAAWVPPAPPLP
jgi:hypothetical protein